MMKKILGSLATVAVLSVGAVPAWAQSLDSVIRTTEFDYDPTTGQLILERVEPGAADCVETRYEYDSYGNKAKATVQKCSTTSAAAGFASRVTISEFNAGADAGMSYPAGAFQTRSRVGTSAAGATSYLSESAATYDARFGLNRSKTAVAQADASKSITSRTEYDGFGRVYREYTAVKRNGDGSLAMGYSQHAYVYCVGSKAPQSRPSACLNMTQTLGVSYPTQRLVDTAGYPTSTAQISLTTAYYIESTPYGPDNAVIGAKSRVHFDSLHREFARETQNYDGSWSRTLTGYDQLGNAAANWGVHIGRDAADNNQLPLAEARQWTTIRDLGHRPIEQRQFVRLSSSSGAIETRVVMAYKGLESTVTTPGDSTPDGTDRRVTTRKYGSGKTAQTENADGATLTLAYDPVGNVVRSVDALGNTTTITYTPRTARFKTSMVDPDQGTWSYTYDALGQLLTQTDARSKTTTMTYDGLGRMTSKLTGDLNSFWYYDKTEAGEWCASGLNRLCESKVPTKPMATRRQLAYDSLGRVYRTVATLDRDYSSEVAFDDYGRPAKATYPTGFAVRYAYSAAGAGRTPGVLERVSDAALASRIFWSIDSLPPGQVFDARGKLLKAQLGNGVLVENRYDPLSGSSLGLFAGRAGVNNVLAQIYEYDKAHNLKQRTDSNTGVVETFAYDILERLTSYTLASSLDLGAARTISLRYNAIGNILDKSDVGAYTYTAGDRPHAVRTAGGVGYTYDANGNIETSYGGRSRNHVWTDFNQPQTLSFGARTVAFNYDADHKRVKEVTTDGSTVRTLYLVHPDNAGGLGFEREETRVGGALALNESRHYISVGGGAFAVVKTLNDSGVVSTDARLTNYWHKDLLGSVVAVTDASGAVLERMAFDAWGRRLQPTGRVDNALNPANGNRGFTGHEHLDELALIHMNGRVFDPLLARFMSPDSIVEAPEMLQAYNRYTYVLNNPLKYTDPSGHCIWDGCVGFALVVGFALSEMGNKYWSTVGAITMTLAAPDLVEAGLGSYSSAFKVGGVGNSFVAASGTSLLVSEGDLGFALKEGLFAAAFTWAGNRGKSLSPERLALHTLLGCAQGALTGGKCGPSAAAALFGKVTTGVIDGSVDPVARGLAAIVAGGTASVLGGGKFSNGAVQAAFGYLFNEVAHRMGGPYGPGSSQDRRFYSAESGVVETLGWENPNDHTQGYGFRIKIRTVSDESLFVYAHVDPSSTRAFEGLLVSKGEYIGQYASPANGGATGPHLHFEWWSKSGTRLNPAAYLPIVMPSYGLRDTIRFRNVHPVTGKPRWHNGYDLVGPTPQ